MSDYLQDLVQNIITKCDISGFVELSTAIQDSTKKAKALTRTLNRAITPEQRLEIEKLKLAQREASATTALHRVELEKQRQQTVLNNIEYVKERNNISDNRLELERLKNARAKNNNETRLAMRNTTELVAEQRREASQNRLNTQLSRERVAQMRREIAEQRRLNRERMRSGIGWGGRVGAYLGAYFGLHTLKNIIDTGSRIQLLQKSIIGLTKSTQDWEYVKKEAFGKAIDLEVVAKGYRNFYASAKMAGFGKGNIQSMYSDLLLSTRAAGVSRQATEGALLSIEQMLSKGRVSMEELRKQLGNALPGAFEMGARAMKMSTKEFNAALQDKKGGGISSIEFVPKLIAQIKKELAGGFEGVAQTMSFGANRLKVAWQIFQTEIFEGETGKTYAQALDTIAKMLISPEFTQFAKLLGQIFALIVKIISFLIKNMKIVLMVIGIGGLYGWLGKTRSLLKLFTMDVVKSTAVMLRFGRMGIGAFRGMSLAASAFIRTLFRVLAPLLLIEDLMFFIMEQSGYDVKSQIGANIALHRRKQKYKDVTLDTLPKELRESPVYKKAVETQDWGKVQQIMKSFYNNPLLTSGNVGLGGVQLAKDEQNHWEIKIGDININGVDTNNQQAVGLAVQNGLLSVFTSNGLLTNTANTITGQGSVKIINSNPLQ